MVLQTASNRQHVSHVTGASWALRFTARLFLICSSSVINAEQTRRFRLGTPQEPIRNTKVFLIFTLISAACGLCSNCLRHLGVSDQIRSLIPSSIPLDRWLGGGFGGSGVRSGLTPITIQLFKFYFLTYVTYKSMLSYKS